VLCCWKVRAGDFVLTQKWGRKRLHFRKRRIDALHQAEMGTKVTAQLYGLDGTYLMGPVRSIRCCNSLCLICPLCTKLLKTKVNSVSEHRSRRIHFDPPMQQLAKKVLKSAHNPRNHSQMQSFPQSAMSGQAIPVYRSIEIHRAWVCCGYVFSPSTRKQ
jgi:hypothetical protein